MTEAWLLFDEPAIRFAAGNPQGKEQLELPGLSTVERVADPKTLLAQALRRASGLGGRRLRRWSQGEAVHRLSLRVSDFSPLCQLAAFRSLQEDLVRVISERGWRGFPEPDHWPLRSRSARGPTSSRDRQERDSTRPRRVTLSADAPGSPQGLGYGYGYG